MKLEAVHELELHAAREDDIAQRWWALSPGTRLLLSNGEVYQLEFAGRAGGSAGPDIRDAVLRLATARNVSAARKIYTGSSRSGKKISGDVEFHLRASDWFAHRHHTDVRYNNVILHLVLLCDGTSPTLRQDGAIVPICSLHDIAPIATNTASLPMPWPCRQGFSLLSEVECRLLLQRAGLARFAQKTHAFLERLQNAQAHGPFSAYDSCLITALAEGFGYGRDRDFFRAAGLRLLGLPARTPEPLGHTLEPPSLDLKRVQLLTRLVENWRVSGAWNIFQTPLKKDLQENSAILQELRALFGGLSTARADILICNIVLPFAAAIASIEEDAPLAERSRWLYLEYPALPSNSITRAMCSQLQLAREPRNACQQQGLHHIYSQTCQQKLCGQCIAGKPSS